MGSMSSTNIAGGVGGISSASDVSNAGGMEHYNAAVSTCMLHTSLLITYGNFS
jgi:hypothetical protein